MSCLQQSGCLCSTLCLTCTVIFLPPQGAMATSSCSCWRVTRTCGKMRGSCSSSDWSTPSWQTTLHPCARTSGKKWRGEVYQRVMMWEEHWQKRVGVAVVKSDFWIQCFLDLFQHPEVCCDSSVYKLWFDWLGPALRHSARAYQGLQREEEDSSEHRAPHHAAGTVPSSSVSFREISRCRWRKCRLAAYQFLTTGRHCVLCTNPFQ